jgi:hypothetical protein
MLQKLGLYEKGEKGSGARVIEEENPEDGLIPALSQC